MAGNVQEGRVTAAARGDVVVFLIGMRINKLRALRSWLPVFVAMPRMLKELSKDPSSGLLGFRVLIGGLRDITVLQYWESEEALFAYASAGDKEHRPAWAAYNRKVRNGGADVGIWHETYAVPAGRYESIYGNMPPHGLGAVHGTEPVGRRGERAAERMSSDRTGG
jgi:fumigallin biosynthesis monooxygenase-like protein